MEILNWHINFTNVTNDKLLNILSDTSTRYLLNTDQFNFDLLEKYIYDIAMFHFERLNIKYNKDINYIEFWYKNKVNLDNNFHFICDEYERKINNNHYETLTKNGACAYLRKDNICSIQKIKPKMCWAWPVHLDFRKNKKIYYLMHCPLTPYLSEKQIKIMMNTW